jgi:hypothetical protein
MGLGPGQGTVSVTVSVEGSEFRAEVEVCGFS